MEIHSAFDTPSKNIRAFFEPVNPEFCYDVFVAYFEPDIGKWVSENGYVIPLQEIAHMTWKEI